MCLCVYIIYCYVTMKQIILNLSGLEQQTFLNISVGQELGITLADWFWLRIFYEVAIWITTKGSSHLKARLGLEDLLSHGDWQET